MSKKKRNRHRDPNPPEETAKIEFELTGGATDMIDQLVDHGIFGVDRNEVCERLVCRGLEELCGDDFILLDDDD